MIELEYITKLKQVIEKISVEQSENIRAAADICAEVINSGKLVHLLAVGIVSSQFRMFSRAMAVWSAGILLWIHD